MPAVTFMGKEIAEVKLERLAELKQSAALESLRRARLCLHLSHSDNVQEMIIAFCHDSYIRPHRHTNKSESFHVIEGELAVLIFDDAGNVTQQVTMGAPESGHAFVCRLSTTAWHSVLPLSEFVVIHETTGGPFVEGQTEFASWSPVDGDVAAIATFRARMIAPLERPR